jgi:hypothetical protein
MLLEDILRHPDYLLVFDRSLQRSANRKSQKDARWNQITSVHVPELTFGISLAVLCLVGNARA